MGPANAHWRSPTRRNFLHISSTICKPEEEFLDSFFTGVETWVFHFTPKTKQNLCVWRHSTSPKQKMFKQAKSAGKVMATLFWNRKEILLIDLYASWDNNVRSQILRNTMQTQAGDPELPQRNAKQGRNTCTRDARVTQDFLKQFSWTVTLLPMYLMIITLLKLKKR